MMSYNNEVVANSIFDNSASGKEQSVRKTMATDLSHSYAHNRKTQEAKDKAEGGFFQFIQRLFSGQSMK